MSIPFDIPIDFEKLEGFTPTIRPLADGLRASAAAECVSCAIIAYLDPNDDRVAGDFVNPGVATLGHLLHQCWAWQVFDHADSEVEAVIPWKHGVSHDDVIVRSGEWAGVYEVKTHSDPKPKAPSAANHRQARFRMRLREHAGLVVPGPMRLVMIGKTGREGGWVRGPWEVTLDDTQRNEIDAQLAAIDSILNRVGGGLDLHTDAELKFWSNGCTRCFPKPKVYNIKGVDGWLGRYTNLKREHDAIDTQRKVYADAKSALKKDLDAARAEIDKLVPDGVVVEALSGATATRNRAGSLSITVPRNDAENAA